jgi:hypothetical protein
LECRIRLLGDIAPPLVIDIGEVLGGNSTLVLRSRFPGGYPFTHALRMEIPEMAGQPRESGTIKGAADCRLSDDKSVTDKSVTDKSVTTDKSWTEVALCHAES